MKRAAGNIAMSVVGILLCVWFISTGWGNQAVWGFLLCVHVVLVCYNSIALGVAAKEQEEEQP